MNNTLREKIYNFTEREKALFRTHKNPFRVLKNRTLLFDSIIRETFTAGIKNRHLEENVFIAAVGGYGRKELYPRSDIDLLIVHKKIDESLLKQIVDIVIIPMMDAKVDVGYAFRRFSDMPKDFDKDLASITAALNIRFLAGSYACYEDWVENKLTPFIRKERKRYFKYKTAEYRRRFQKYNQTPYILEPNIKEGIGGLRELHYIRWLGKVTAGIDSLDDLHHVGFVENQELQSIKRSYEFLSRVRCYMHFFHYVQKEIMSFELQDEIADFLGYHDTDQSLKVEKFMTDFYRHSHDVVMFATKLIHHFKLLYQKRGSYQRQRIDLGIYLEGLGETEIQVLSREIKDNPRLLLKCFHYAKISRKAFSYTTRNYMKRVAKKAGIFKWDDELRNIFLQIISPDSLYTHEILMEMYNSDFLPMLFPEFADIYHKMQFDAYHIYTVDIHSIMAVKKLCEFFKENKEKIGQKVRNPALLSLAVLFHDIGKGGGKDHALKGADIVKQICARMGMDHKDTDLLVFLVKNHLLLSNIAQRRDLSDLSYLEKVYTEVIRTRENLTNLYFLTLADLMSVGEGVWNAWKERLFKELYANFERIAAADTGQKITADEHLAEKMNAILNILDSGRNEHLIPYLDNLNIDYILGNDIKMIVRDMTIEHEFMTSAGTRRPYLFKMFPHQKGKYIEIVIAARDEKGLFSRLAGCLTLAGFNILSANINTRKNGGALDIFFVDLGKRDFEFDEYLENKLNDCLDKVLVQQKSLDVMITERIKKYHKRSIFKEKNAVLFDNNSSDNFTIIDIFAHDRVGLLYEITKTLSSLGLDIHFSRISTYGERAVDVFYVLKGRKKVVSEQEQKQIHEALLKVVTA